MLDTNTASGELAAAASPRSCVAHFFISVGVAVSNPVNALLGLADALPANAASFLPTSRTVQLDDLDLTTSAGIAELERRVKHSAREVYETSGTTGAHPRSSPCVAATSTTAISALSMRPAPHPATRQTQD